MLMWEDMRNTLRTTFHQTTAGNSLNAMWISINFQSCLMSFHPRLCVCWGYWWDLSLKSHSQFSNGYILSPGRPLGVIQSPLWFVYVLMMTWSGILHFYELNERTTCTLPEKTKTKGPFCSQDECWKKFERPNCLFTVAHTEHMLPLAKAHMAKSHKHTMHIFTHSDKNTQKH